MQTYQPTVDLTQLRDLASPSPVSYTPQTAGWYVLGIVALTIAAWIAWRWLAHRRANRYRREALGELRRIEASLSGSVSQGVVVEVDALAKRVALVSFGRDTVASLTGHDWLMFLDRTYGGRSRLGRCGESRSTAFTSGDGRPLGELPYQRVSERQAMSLDQAKALAILVRRWIRSHRVPV